MREGTRLDDLSVTDATLNQPVIATERFVLRPLRPSDAGMIAHYTADKRVAEGTRAIPHPLPPGASEGFVARALSADRAEDVWAMAGGQGLLVDAPWPKADPAMLEDDTVTLPIQINGKRRAEITVPKTMPKSEIEALVLGARIVETWADPANARACVAFALVQNY